jgi:hypothetical protein
MMYCYVIVTLILKFSLSFTNQGIGHVYVIYFPGKVFPKIHRRAEQPAISISSSEDDASVQSMAETTDDDPTTPHGDYVFRIVFSPDR